MCADVVGYSRLMGADEEGTLAALNAVRRSLFDPTIAEHRGRIVRAMGDGLLVEFNSVVDAVRCAIKMQNEMPDHTAEMPEDRRIQFRVAIAMGDVVPDGALIYGQEVDIGCLSPSKIWVDTRSRTLHARSAPTALCWTSRRAQPARRRHRPKSRRWPCCRFRTSAAMSKPSSFSTVSPRI